MGKVKEFISGAELLKLKFEPLAMLSTFLPSCGFVLVSGVPGAGKTEFLMHQAVQIALKGRVLFFCNEGGPRNFQLRLKAYCKNDIALNNFIYEQERWPNLSEDKGIEFLENVITKFGPKAIFIDSGPDAFGEENDAALLKEPLRKISELVNRLQVCIVFSWHPAKGLMPSGVYNLRGSTSISGKIDMMYDLTLQGKRRVIILHKMRTECIGLRQFQRWVIEQVSNGDDKDLKFNDVQEAKEAHEEKQRDLLQEALSQFIPGNEYSSTEIQSTLLRCFNGDIKETTAKKYLKKWLSDNRFILVQENKGQKPSTYKRVEDEIQAFFNQ